MWREEPWFIVDDANGWNAAIAKARADAPPVPDLAALLTAGEAEGKDAVSREAFGRFLLNERGFPGGFWHPDDDDGLLGVFGGWMTDAGLPGDLMADEKLRAELTANRRIHGGANRRRRGRGSPPAGPLRRGARQLDGRAGGRAPDACISSPRTSRDGNLTSRSGCS